MQGKPVSRICSYLPLSTEVMENFKKRVFSKVEDVLNLEVLVELLLINTFVLVKNASEKMLEGMNQGLSAKDSWDQFAGIDLVEASKSHVKFFVLSNFHNFIKTDSRKTNLGIL